MTNSKELKTTIENQKTECLWSELESDGLTESAYLLDYDLDLIDVALGIVENNERMIKGLIADGLFYPPTAEEINNFINQSLLLNTIKLDSHTLIQAKTRL